jgi:hypothetical protein
VTNADPNNDPAWREKIADVLRSWEGVGIIGPAWSVEYSPCSPPGAITPEGTS